MHEVNTRLRSDPALQRAFNRTACAEQSVVQDTFDACTSTNVGEMMLALDDIFQKHSLAFRHDYERLMLMIEDMERTLNLEKENRKKVIIRMDAGGGSLDEVNWLLERGYQIHGKDISAARAESFAQTVKHWISDPNHPHRQMGWAMEDPEFVRPVKRLVLRWPPMSEKERKKRPFHYACLLSTLEPAEVLRQLSLPVHTMENPDAMALAYSTLYDKRGGTVEVEIKESKQGIGINKRSKKRFAAGANGHVARQPGPQYSCVVPEVAVSRYTAPGEVWCAADGSRPVPHSRPGGIPQRRGGCFESRSTSWPHSRVKSLRP